MGMSNFFGIFKKKKQKKKQDYYISRAFALKSIELFKETEYYKDVCIDSNIDIFVKEKKEEIDIIVSNGLLIENIAIYYNFEYTKEYIVYYPYSKSQSEGLLEMINLHCEQINQINLFYNEDE